MIPNKPTQQEQQNRTTGDMMPLAQRDKHGFRPSKEFTLALKGSYSAIPHGDKFVVPLNADINEKTLIPFSNGAGPHVYFPKFGARQIFPVSHPVVRAYVTHMLFELRGGQAPNRSEVDNLLAVIAAKAHLNVTANLADDWQDRTRDQVPILLALTIMADAETPNPLTGGSKELLDKATVLAGKEGIDRGESWPKAPNIFSMVLEENIPTMWEMGYDVTKLPRINSGRRWRIQKREVGATPDALLGASSPSATPPNLLALQELENSGVGDAELVAKIEQALHQQVTPKPMSDKQILAWLPRVWGELPGNEGVKRAAEHLIRTTQTRSRENLLILGDKYDRRAVMSLVVSKIFCDELQAESLDPCGKCLACVQRVDEDSEYDAGGSLSGNEDDMKYIRFTKTSSPNEIARTFDKVKAFKGRLVINLDGLDQFKTKSRKELIAQLADSRASWVGTADSPGSLEDELLFTFGNTHTTTDPSQAELALDLANKCREWDIRVEAPQVLIRLAQRSRCKTSESLRVLAEARKTRGGLTVELVGGFTF